MKNNTLDGVISSIEEWCGTNGISIFYADLTDEDGEILWNKRSDEDWKKFLETQKNANSKILILDITINEIEVMKEDIRKLKDHLTGAEHQEFEEALKIVRENEGKAVSFDLGFYYNNKWYRYYDCSPWSSEYQTVMDFILDHEDELPKKDAEENKLNTKMEQYIHKILENKSYLSAPNQMTREDIVGHILLKEGIENRVEVIKIAKLAESKFVLEIKPKQEEERKNLVLGYKRQGYNKKQTISKSGLGESIVDKYWYIDD